VVDAGDEVDLFRAVRAALSVGSGAETTGDGLLRQPQVSLVL
jgi:hypothetical protein